MAVLAKLIYAYECVGCGDIVYSAIFVRLPRPVEVVEGKIRAECEHVGRTSDGHHFFCGKRRLVSRYYTAEAIIGLRKFRKSARITKAHSSHAKRNRVRRKAVALLDGK